MRSVLRSLPNPLRQELDLLRTQSRAAALGRHALVVVGAGDPLDEGATFGVPGGDGHIAAQVARGSIAYVEPQPVNPALALLGVRTVTLGAAVGKNRLDVAVKVDLRRRSV